MASLLMVLKYCF